MSPGSSPGGLQSLGKIKRSLSSKLDYYSERIFRLEYMKHVFQGHRLEEQLVRRVVIGAHCFRVGIHHDTLITLFTQGKGCMNAAVIELDALADAVRASPQYDNLRFR